MIKIRKKSRLKKRVMLFLATGLVLSAVVWAGWRLADIKEVHLLDGLFRIRTVQVEGISTGRAADVRAIVKKQPNASLSKLDPEKIQEALTRLPWIKEVQFRKEWPDALVIKVAERTPFAWVEDREPVGSERGHYRLVDDDGVELDSLSHPAAGFPVIRLGSASNNSDPGRTKLKAGIQILKAFAASGVEPEALEEAAVEVRDAQDVLIQYKGLPLRLGFGDPKEQIRRFLFLRPELMARSPEISEVDLRFPGRLIVRSKMGFVGATRRVARIKGEAEPHPYTERR